MAIGSRFSQHSFAQIPDVHMARSRFDRSFTHKTTGNFDYLIPIYVDEVIPGDTHKVSVNSFIRLATQKVPVMDNMKVEYFSFFVPNRLVYDKWEQLNGAQANPDDTTDYICPQLPLGALQQFEVGTIYDYMGLPTDVNNVLVRNSMPLRGYLKIWNDWFRDENLQDSVPVPIDEGPDAITDFMLLKRGKRHDYFTSALPFPQKGPDVNLPLGTSAPVKGIGKGNQNYDAGPSTVYQTGDSTSSVFGDNMYIDPQSANYLFRIQEDPNNPGFPGIYTDLTEASAATINALREAFQMQSLFELDARGGTRYVEILRAHFNVISPDFRLQRAEFLGSGFSYINVNPVAQTSPTSGGNTQAQLAAFATSSTGPSDRVGFSKSFVEHGYVFILACVRGEITYQQGMNRMWNRSTRYDFFWPKLQQLGEQEILNREIYTQGQAVTDTLGVIDDQVFGYQERYGEYRYFPSMITGQFRSTFITPLDQWHLAEEFDALPELNEEFIEQNTPIERAIAVTTEGYPQLLMDFYFKVNSARPMLSYSVPISLGRF